MTSSKRRNAPPRNVPPPEGGRPTANYARFIPREELSSFAAWSPEALTGGAAAANAALRRTTDREPPAPGAPSAAEELALQLRAARQSGYQDGYRDGLAGLDEFRQSFARQITQQIDTLTESYQRELDALHLSPLCSA